MSVPTQLRDNAFMATGTEVNWILLKDGNDLTLIDSGYPRDVEALEESIRFIGGKPEDVRAILLTHAHIDHIGGINHFYAKYGTPVYMNPTEVAHARRDYLEQATPLDVTKNIAKHGVLGWSLRIMRAGAIQHVDIPHALPFPTSGALDLPGNPVPVFTPGHTSGHSAYHVPALGIVASGDGLITGHAVSKVEGPQLLTGMFHHSEADALAALAALENLDADLLLPGHGRPYEGAIRDSVAIARGRAQR